ncbi:hypothetical protein G3A39_39375, partial [Paraburkholderia aspalathi]|nr:hypothetical protein [Paraburkholderia aspalathi]
MSKILQSLTIIPKHLYVERSADRQINDVIQQMGRPAYILVARQMGKTNLLLHMKRTRESVGDIVFYFDLSSRASTYRLQLRDIIDQILESGVVGLGGLTEAIKRDRATGEYEPNKEYDRHLRLVLRAIPDRKIIIILDEVDSLTTIDYSDAFFAQIRSMYFSRINFPEYERLTYALAGVAEPTDLIRDKSISPFNIGEKIYLDDFSINEVKTLILRSELNIQDDILNYIYGWCGGNPRITWDLLSSVEDFMRDSIVLTKGRVDEAVERLYLERFDRAPIDHIRVLAESDPLIRNAIIAIRWGKADTLDERTKSRLYLAGVTSANSSGGVVIKNKILDVALSDSWLQQLPVTATAILEAASQEYVAKRFGATVRLIDEYLNSQQTETLPPEARAQLGISLVHEGENARAIEHL